MAERRTKIIRLANTPGLAFQVGLPIESPLLPRTGLERVFGLGLRTAKESAEAIRHRKICQRPLRERCFLQPTSNTPRSA